MANIKVNDIKSAGAKLFDDFESFINDLEDNELSVAGGRSGFRTRSWECRGL